jgi:hypothetical protein
MYQSKNYRGAHDVAAIFGIAQQNQIFSEIHSSLGAPRRVSHMQNERPPLLFYASAISFKPTLLPPLKWFPATSSAPLPAHPSPKCHVLEGFLNLLTK